MSYQPNDDNVYAVGSVVTARSNPALQLKIMKYYQRIYYCVVIGDAGTKQLVYFEGELTPAAQTEVDRNKK